MSAFPSAEFYGDQPEDQTQARSRCQSERRTTLFVELPVNGKFAHQPISLIFDQTKVKVVALCEECTDSIYDATLRFGFSGVIPLQSSKETYRRAAHAVQRGELWLPREYLSKLTRQFFGTPGRLDLTGREVEILKLILEGSSNQEIANRLFIDRETVRWHLKSLYRKLGVSSRGAARQFAHNVLFHL